MSEQSNQEQYYETMNWVTTPVRLVKGYVQTVFFILGLIAIGLSYPIIVFMNHEPLTFAVFAVPLLVLLAIFTFFYATYYLLFGGALFIVCWVAYIIKYDAPTHTQTLWIWFAFFAVGIAQAYIHRLIAEWGKPKPASFVEQMNQTRLKVMTRRYDKLDRETRAAKIRQYGDNYFSWPEPW